jgi:putative oxidoreductase
MFWAVLAVRVLVGLPFLVFGLNYFLNFFPMPEQSMPDAATKFLAAIVPTGYLTAVKVLEVVGGALVLSGRLVPLGLVLVTPVAVNIALYDLCLMGKPALGVVLTILCAFLVWAYRSHFAPVFAVKPKIG